MKELLRVKSICAYCGRETLLVPWRARRNRFCSKSCGTKARGKNRIELICPQCGRKKLMIPSYVKRFIFCSKKCYGDSIKGIEMFSDEQRKKINDAKRGKKRAPFSKECIGNMSETHKKPKVTVFCHRCGKPITVRPGEAKFRKFCNIKCSLANMSKDRPNGAEQVLLDLLNQYFPNEWKYTGDFSVWFGKKNPDFMNVDGKKKLIELFGKIHHRKEEEATRINHFKQFGFDTLVIWADELRNKEFLKEKLINFERS